MRNGMALISNLTGFLYSGIFRFLPYLIPYLSQKQETPVATTGLTMFAPTSASGQATVGTVARNLASRNGMD